MAKSYTQLYRRLPEQLLGLLQQEYSPSDLDKLLAGFMDDRITTLRVNCLKTNVRQVMEVFRKLNLKFDRVLWYDDALVLQKSGEKDLQESELYQTGAIYLQNLSSMIPPLVLQPLPGSKILDLTAAPGSKTTQLAALMENRGYLLANELDQIRAERLRFNIQQQGAAIVEIRQGDGKRLDHQYEGFFDQVLLDAPCSGTGCIEMSHPQTYRAWSLKQLNYLIKEQRKLLERAFWALKPGGTLVYSTCSLLREEYQEIIKQFLANHPRQALLQDIGFNLTGAEGLVRYSRLEQSGGRMMTLLPSSQYEGFFIAKLKKLS